MVSIWGAAPHVKTIWQQLSIPPVQIVRYTPDAGALMDTLRGVGSTRPITPKHPKSFHRSELLVRFRSSLRRGVTVPGSPVQAG